jgi:hypothetical protein
MFCLKPREAGMLLKSRPGVTRLEPNACFSPGPSQGEMVAKKIERRLKTFALGQKDDYNRRISQLISDCGNPSL